MGKHNFLIIHKVKSNIGGRVTTERKQKKKKKCQIKQVPSTEKL